MEQVITRDNSITFLNEHYDEHYHSVSAGALKEALVKYVQPCNLKPGARVLDVCFGLGYNSLMALSVTKNISITALENDQNILDAIQNISVPKGLSEDFNKIKQAASSLKYKDNETEITIILADALETIKKLSLNFDAVFFDPFSPKKQPELWTEEFFRDIRKLMNPGAILTTYSCATHVRKKLSAAGFKVADGPILGRKSPATIAIS